VDAGVWMSKIQSPAQWIEMQHPYRAFISRISVTITPARTAHPT
jgi:hypothetical protein